MNLMVNWIWHIRLALCLVPALLWSSSAARNATSLILEGSFNVLPTQRHDSCDNIRLYGPRGTIASPRYPNHYQNSISCMWSIIGLPNHVITISFDDLDIEVPKKHQKLLPESGEANDNRGNSNEECIYNWVKIGPAVDGSEQKFCGRSQDSVLANTFTSAANIIWVKFHTSIKVFGGRGFHLTYIVTPKQSVKCKDDEFRCANGKCILDIWRCNRKSECEDGSDEVDCEEICVGSNQVKCASHNTVPGCYSFPSQRCNLVWDCDNGADEKGCGGCPHNMFMCRNGLACFSEAKRCDGIVDCTDFTDELNCGFCGANRTQCGPSSLVRCYDPFTQRCDRNFDCPNGEDEMGCIHGCHNKILCASGSGCYSLEERCNGFPECSDMSDEKNCSLDLCRVERGRFLCGNGRCIRSVWMCDRSDDCGDKTDELNCVRNSVITAAIMGSLICGLLLVIAISCTCKLIALRQAERSHIHSHSSPAHISSPYERSLGYGDSDTQFRLEHGFLFREPPPSYAASVGNLPSDRDSTYIEHIRQIRRQRRLRRNRRRPPTPPPAFIEGENTDGSPPSSGHPTPSSTELSPTGPNERTESQNDSDKDDDQLKDDQNTSNGSETNCIPISSSSTNLVHIELDHIPSLTSLSQDDCNCDSQPLIS